MSAVAPGTPALTWRAGIDAARAGDRREMLRLLPEQVLAIVAPLVVVSLLLEALTRSSAAFDFQHAYLAAGHAVLAGTSPYRASGTQIREALAFVYPAFSALVFAPFALLPSGRGLDVLATLLCVSATPLTVWALGVRDWRVYAITLCWMPVYGAWQTANETMFLVLLVALVWRYRDHPLAAGVLAAVAISLKPIIWPLGLWLLATRRWRAAAYTLGCGLTLNIAAWAVVGFGQIDAYLHVAAADSRYAWDGGYSIAAALAQFGLGHPVGDAVTVLLCLALAATVIRLGRTRERQAISAAVALMLVASPLVWSHYFALLIVPLALARPRMAWVWVLPLLFWVCRPPFQVSAFQEAIVWATVAALFAGLTRSVRA